MLVGNGHPTCCYWASSQRSHTVCSMLCYAARTSAPLSSHLFIRRECTASQIEAPIRTRHTIRTTYQFVSQQMWGALVASPIECEVVGEHHETLYFHPDISTHSPGMALPTTVWVQLNHLCTGVGRFCFCLHKGQGPFCGLRVWCRGADHQPCCPLVANPSTSVLSAWPDSSGWRDNQITAQHLFKDLVQSSSG